MSKRSKKTLGQRFCERLDIPLGAIGKASFVEMVGRCEVTVGGCIGLLNYTENEITLRLCDGIVDVKGEDLELRGFALGRVEIRGYVTCICFDKEV